MLTESMLTAILGLSPGSYAPPEPEPICASLPSSPERIDAQPFAATAADGVGIMAVDEFADGYCE